MYCGNCGTNLPDGEQRCPVCGWTPGGYGGLNSSGKAPSSGTQYGSGNYADNNQGYNNTGYQNYAANGNGQGNMPADRTVYDRNGQQGYGETAYQNNQTGYGETAYQNNQTGYGETAYQNNRNGYGETEYPNNQPDYGRTAYQNNPAPYGDYSDTYRGDVYRGDGSRYDDIPPSGKKKSAVVVGILIAVIVMLVAALGVGAWYFMSDSDGKDKGDKKTASSDAAVQSSAVEDTAVDEEKDDNAEAEKEAEEEKKRKDEQNKERERMSADLAPSINSILDAQSMSSSVGVAIIDNIDGKVYNAGAHNFSFSAWGFYLPIYLAYTAEFGEGSASGIMSSDPATCNQAANNAIDALGGLSSMNYYLRNNYNLSYTSYSRRFGQAASPGVDNYTSASEAVGLVADLYRSGRSGKLSYVPSSFGISVPYGASMYSQIGTENRNVKKNLNLFAVVEGANSSYCVVIMTKDTVSRTGIMNTLLDHIHSSMEAMHQ